VKCWGNNSHGQLGNSLTSNSNVPVDVSGFVTGASAISAGHQHSCAVVSGGARCWGRNDFGQLGNNSQVGATTPVNVTNLASGVSAISAGAEFSCAVTQSGSAQCWGRNNLGQLGDSTNSQRLIPTQVTGLASGVTMVNAGSYHGCALSSSGAARCWGYNAQGQVGNGGASNFTLPTATPALVSNLASTVGAVSAGYTHSCALMLDGGVKCWGLASYGQLGDGTGGHKPVTTTVLGLSSGVAAVEGGYEFSCSLSSSGRVQCWGNNGQGQLGNGNTTSSTSPGDVSGLGSGVASLSAGMGTGGHACVVTSGGGAKCWGSGSLGRLGNGSSADRLAPTDVTNLTSGVSAISAGGFHTCALTTGGGMKCWGYNFYGAVGDGGAGAPATPVDVVGLASGVTAITTGYYHSCALTSTGGVKCWGWNANGQLGNGNTTDSNVPVDVSTLATGVIAVSAGQSFTCALLSGGVVKCWGENSSGQLGTASGPDVLVPTTVPGLPNDIVAINASNFHACALTSTGGMKCWGANSEGQLGDGSTENRVGPVDVAGLAQGVSRIDAGGDHTCARTALGEAKCWGRDTAGQLGDAGRNYLIPGDVMIDALGSAAASDGDEPSYAVTSDASGRFLVFESQARTLGTAPDANEAPDIFRRDLLTNEVVRISVDDSENEITAASIEPSVAADGQRIVFVTEDAAIAKVRNESKAARERRLKATTHGVYLRNMINGATFRMSLNIPAMPGGVGTTPVLSPSGNALVYTGQVGDPAMGQPGPQVMHVPISYLPNGDPLLGTARCVSCKVVDATGRDTSINASGASRNAVVSADGQWVAFETGAKNFLAAAPSLCPSAGAEIMLRNLITGATQRVSTPPIAGNCGLAGAGSSKPSMDWDGRKIVYESDQPLTTSDRNNRPDVFLFELGQGISRISEALDSAYDGNGDSVQGTISGDGRVIAFRSAAKNLEPREPDNNETEDIYIRRLDQALMRRVSRNKRGDQADLTSRHPTMNYNGTKVAFDTDATNLGLEGATNELLDRNGVGDVYQTNNPTTAEVVFRSGF
jgi:alpha-tubulin suppressor-like RCC1 family protein/Tol biopolymer transport system component